MRKETIGVKEHGYAWNEDNSWWRQILKDVFCACFGNFSDQFNTFTTTLAMANNNNNN